jgi:hypothetical protein
MLMEDTSGPVGTALTAIAVAYDKLNKRYVKVAVDSAGKVTWSVLKVPATSPNDWSTPQQVALPSGFSAHASSGLSLCPANISQGMVCVMLATSGGSAYLLAFRIGDPNMVKLSVPSDYYTGYAAAATRGLGSAGTQLGLFYIGQDINDRMALFYNTLDVKSWPPLDGSWANWGGCDKQIPAFGYTTSQVYVFRVAKPSSSPEVLSYCYASQTKLDFSAWYGLGSLPGGASFLNPAVGGGSPDPYSGFTEPLVVLSAQGSGNQMLCYAPQYGGSIGTFSSVSKCSHVTAVACAPWNQTLPVVLSESGSLYVTLYDTVKETFTAPQATLQDAVTAFAPYVLTLTSGQEVLAVSAFLPDGTQLNDVLMKLPAKKSRIRAAARLGPAAS